MHFLSFAFSIYLLALRVLQKGKRSSLIHKLMLLSLSFPVVLHLSFFYQDTLRAYQVAIIGAMALSWLAVVLHGIEFRPFPSSGVIPKKILIKIPLLGLLLGYFVGQSSYWQDKAYILPIIGMLLSLYFLYTGRVLYRLSRRYLYYSLFCFLLVCLITKGRYEVVGFKSWVSGLFMMGHYYFLNKLFNGFWIRHHIVKS